MNKGSETSFYVRYGKRWFDASAALGGLILLSPLLLVAAVAVRLDSPGPSFFLQLRTGRFSNPFRMIKFRTMRLADEGNASLLTAAGDSRVTRVGRWLRKTKVDELPQLFNVLLGEMSLVGPRPEVPRFTQLYTQDQRRVLFARPGITSPAALASVNEEEILAQHADPESFYVHSLMPAKLQLDLAYCTSISFHQDLKLIGRTLGRLSKPRRFDGVEQNKLTANPEKLA
jgi:lipopolysaccharide/colanic/teichoic acid biosynthesis glycosyltransferase